MRFSSRAQKKIVAIKRHASVASTINETGSPVVMVYPSDDASDVGALHRAFDANGDGGSHPSHAPHEKRYAAAAELDGRVGTSVQHDRLADFEIHDAVQGKALLVEDRVDLDAGGPELGREMAFPDGVAAELLAHELLQKQL